jgi:hypothetical protein
MESYIEQLVEDLRAARKWAPVKKDRENMSDNDVMEELIEIDRIIDEEEEKPMCNIFGIDPVAFPPIEKLTYVQAELLAREILELWQYFNIDAVFPDNFPLYKLYPLLAGKFKKPFLYFPMGITGVEFCHYEPAECPFGSEYCMCKDVDIFSNQGNQTEDEDLSH